MLILFSIFIYLFAGVVSDQCKDFSQCSSNPYCSCLPLANTNKNSSICAYSLQGTCSDLNPCYSSNHFCFEPNTVCVLHPQCKQHLCFPTTMASSSICPPIVQTTTTVPINNDGICAKAVWSLNGTTVAGGNGIGDALNQLYGPVSVVVDHNDDSIYVSDQLNYRVMKWKQGELTGTIVAGGNERGNQSNMLNVATKILLDENDGSLYICDQVNRRVQKWLKGASDGQTLFSNVSCVGLARDKSGSFYVTDWDDSRVLKFSSSDSTGEIVAGGNEKGSRFDQFDHPSYLIVESDGTLIIADKWNSRIMKWSQKGKEGIRIAGQDEQGRNNDQFVFPQSIIMDQMGTLYIADTINNRIVRWFKGATSGQVILGGIESGRRPHQLSYPYDLAFDRYGNLYVADYYNYRVQMFKIDKSAC